MQQESDCHSEVSHPRQQASGLTRLVKRSDRIDASAFQRLAEDHCSILRRAFESYLIWEAFGDLIRNVHRGDSEYPRVFFFQPFTLACVNAAFDSFVTNLYKFHDKISDELNTLVDLGVRYGRVDPELERRLRAQIRTARSFAVKKHIHSLRNRQIGHYDVTADERSSLTTLQPTKEEIREYFQQLAEILKTCAAHTRFRHLPLVYNQLEKRMRDSAEMVTSYIRGRKAP